MNESQPELEKEGLDKLNVVSKKEYGPSGDPNVVVEHLDFGGVCVTVQSPGAPSMRASYGLWMAQRAVRKSGLDGRQLDLIQQFEKKFRLTVDNRLAKHHSTIELTAAEISNALTRKLWPEYQRRMGQLDQQMKDVSAEWQQLYGEYLRALWPILRPEQYDNVESSLGRKKAAP